MRGRGGGRGPGATACHIDACTFVDLISMNQDQIGFPQFQQQAARDLAPLLDRARALAAIGKEMLQQSVEEDLAAVTKQITRTVTSSMESVLILVNNGKGTDALTIGRSMFEAAVTVSYLESHPELVQDFVDFLWVKRKKHYDYLLKFAPAQAKLRSAVEIQQMETEYARVKSRFTNRKGVVRNSWCKLSVAAMAEEIGAASLYGGLYPFTSSYVHVDILRLVAAKENSGEVEQAPSEINVTLALQLAVLNYAIVLTAYDQITHLGMAHRLDMELSSLERSQVAW